MQKVNYSLLTIIAAVTITLSAKQVEKSSAITDSKDKVSFSTSTIIQNLQFKRLTESDGLSCEEVQVLYQDKEGYVWIGTRRGLFRYDGYQTKLFKNTPVHENLLTSNNIKAICDDSHGNLWIGTDEGMTRMNKETGQTVHYHFRNFDNCEMVDCILSTRKGELWVGTDGGLYKYVKSKDDFAYYVKNKRNTIIPHCSVKSIVEDKMGNLWIGTWDSGLYRYAPNKRDWCRFPKFNAANNAQCMAFDQYNRLWIGTWGCGVYVIQNPFTVKSSPQFYKIRIGNNGVNGEFISSLIAENSTGTIWMGTSKGLSVCLSGKELCTDVVNYPNAERQNVSYMDRGITSLATDRSGRVWMSSVSSGAVSTSIRPNFFTNMSVDTSPLVSKWDVIQSVLPVGNHEFWLGLSHSGLLYYNGNTKTSVLWNRGRTPNRNWKLSDIISLCKAKNGSIFVGTRHQGFGIFSGSGPMLSYMRENAPWLSNNCVNCFAEDKKGGMLIGTWGGLCYLNNAGVGMRIEKLGTMNTSTRNITDMKVDKSGVWISTTDDGVSYVQGDISKPSTVSVSTYRMAKEKDMQGEKKFKIRGINKMMIDSKSRLWACSQESGLLEFDRSMNCFVRMNDVYSVPGDNVSSIAEDCNGYLWLTTNLGVVRLHIVKDGSKADTRTFSKLDGVPTNYLSNAVIEKMPDGKVVIGNLKTLSICNFSGSKENTFMCAPQITGIRIFNKPIEDIDPAARDNMADLLPPYTRKLTLESDENDVSMDFSTFTYENPSAIRFAYMLEGYDKEWKYIDGGQHTAYYCNLPSGTYILHLKATNDRGVWCQQKKILTLVVLPSLWLRWWSFLIYLVLIAIAAVIVCRIFRHHQRQKQEIKMARMESEKVKELNHKNLLFFENVTHDLMTPLTVISATAEEMNKGNENSDLKVIQGNVERLMNLLKQMLSFRMTETQKEDVADNPQIIGTEEIYQSEDHDFANTSEDGLVTILLVEDNAELKDVVMRLLNRSYHVLTAENGRMALNVLKSNENIDMVISDVTMPEMDGFELTKKLKSNIETSHIPVLLLTAKRSEKDMMEGYNAGADAYITKPFHFSLLNARIHNLLRSRVTMVSGLKKDVVISVDDMPLTNLDEDFLKRAVEIVKSHLADYDFDQQTFADEICVSRSTLYKKLKTLTGMNTPNFIMNLRMKTACKMIEKNYDIRISDLAYAVGYNSLKYFSYSFKKQYGITPSAYAEDLKKKGGKE